MHRIKWAKIVLALALAIGAAMVLAGLHRKQVHLREQLARLHRDHDSLERLREQNRQKRTLIERVRRGDDESARAIRAELAEAKAEIARREQAAEKRRAEILTASEESARALEKNRDPRGGQMKLEYFKDAGRETPAAALETLVWAAMNGKDELLAGAVGFDDNARTKAEQMLAMLPAETRLRFPSVDKLATLAFSDLVTEQISLQIVNEAVRDSSHATLTVVGGNSSKQVEVRMQRDASGWRIVMPEAAMNRLRPKATKK